MESQVDIIPVVGNTYEIDFGNIAYNNTFESDDRLSFVPVKGAVGQAQSVELHRVQVAPNAYFEYWQEQDKTTVSRYIDLEKRVVYGNITLPDHTFLTL